MVWVVEVLDPMVLSSKIREVCDCGCREDSLQIPAAIAGQFDDELVYAGERRRIAAGLEQLCLDLGAGDLAVLVIAFLVCSYVCSKVELSSLRWLSVVADVVGESIVELAIAYGRVYRQLLGTRHQSTQQHEYSGK